jgi:hypothetical protein
MTTLQSARKYDELLGPDVEASPYNYAMLFKAKGFVARLRARRRFKLLKSIDVRLQRMLRSGEKVYYLTPGIISSQGERIFPSWLAYLLNRHALVFTSNRVLILQMYGRRRPHDLVSQILYVAIASIRSTMAGQCRVKLLNRKTYNFQHVSRADRIFLTKLLAGVAQGTNAAFQPSLGVEHLCPHCFAVVPGYPLTCQACNGAFKSAKKAGLLSLLLPGIGDWYLGYRGVALLELLSYGFMWTVLALAPRLIPAEYFTFAHLQAHYWQAAVLFMLLVHLTSALLTRRFGRKGHHPSGEVQSAEERAHVVSSVLDMPKPDLSAARRQLSLRRDAPSSSTAPADEPTSSPPAAE